MDRLLGELYRLGTLVAADDKLMKAGPGNRTAALQYLRNRFLEEEIIHLLVSTATASRIHAEHMSGPRSDADEISYTQLKGNCGQLWPDIAKSDLIDLTLREACNKIVHALEITIETEGAIESTPIKHVVNLRGKLGSREWRCELNLYAYIELCVANLNVLS